MPRRHTARRTLTAVALTTGLLLSATGTASAERLSRSDPRGDVVKYDNSVPFDERVYQPRPKRRMGDVVRTVARHTNDMVILRTKYAKLTHKQGKPFRVYWLVRTPEFLHADVILDAGPGQWDGELVIHTGFGRTRAATEHCPGVHKIKYRRNYIRVAFPRDCVHDPETIQVGTITSFVKGDSTFGDDGLRGGYDGIFHMSRKLSAG